MNLTQDKLIALAIKNGFKEGRERGELVCNRHSLERFADEFAELLTNSDAESTADYVAYLYRDHNSTLKLVQESPPPENAFPVFTTKIRFLDVARLVLDDNVDLILEHGGVKLWEKLVANVNKLYLRASHSKAEQEAERPKLQVIGWYSVQSHKFIDNQHGAKAYPNAVPAYIEAITKG